MARPTSRLSLLISIAFATLLGLAPASALGQDATPTASTLPDGVTIVANGLDNPRNFTWDTTVRSISPALASAIPPWATSAAPPAG